MDLLKTKLWDVEYQKQQEQIGKDRKLQVGSGDRSEKIRTYNFPQGRVTDHRINVTSHNLFSFLDGNLDEIINPLIQEDQARKLSNT